MIYAIDTNIIYDILLADPESGPSSRDFLIGAHALECADALVTRDRGFMRRWFSDLKIVDPSMT